MAKELLYEIKIKGLDEEINSLKKLQDETKRLREEVKRLETAGSAEAERRKIELTETQQQYKRLQREVQNRNKAEQESVNTLEKMRAKLAAMNQQLERTEVGSEKFKQLTAQTKKLRDEINAADQATGKFQGNVGNYKDAIIDAFKELGINVKHFTGALESTGRTFEVVTAATGRTSGALRVLRLALISTGIGAIVAAFGTLVTYLTSTQAGIDAVNKVLKPLGTVMQRLLGVVQQLGEGLYLIVTGKFAQGWERLKTTMSGIGDEIRGAWGDGQRLAEIIIEIEQARLKLAENEDRLRREMEEQRAILQDVNRTQNERLAAGAKFLAMNNELTGLQKTIATLEAEQLELKLKQNDTDREAQAELAKKRAAIDALVAEQLSSERRVRTQINAIVKDGADARLKAIEVERVQQQKLYDETMININRIFEMYDKSAERSAKVAEAMTKVFRPEEEEEIPDIPPILEALGQLQAEEVKLAQQTTDEIKATYADRFAALDASLRAGMITEEQYANRKRQLNAMIADDTIASLRGVAREGSGIQRALFIFEKIMAVRKAFIALQEGLAKTAGSAPFPANIPLIIGFAAQVAGLISAIKSIAAPEPPKFARGVIGLQGAGSETSDSISAKLSKGESVMTARATRMFAPVLAQMEMAVGNRPNYQLGNRRFAGGYIPAPVDGLGNMDKVIERTIRAIGQIPVVVSERDISETQARVVRIKQTGNL